MTRAASLLLAGTLIASSLTAPALAQLGPEGFFPRTQLARVLPEKLPALEHPAYYGDLEKARALLHRGRYKAALYASFALKGAEPLDVALLRGEAYWIIGEIDLARSTLATFAEDRRAALLLARIDLSLARYDEAIGALKRLADAEPDAVAPRHHLAAAYEAKGDLDAALAVHRTFAEGDASVLAKFKAEGALGFEDAEALTFAASSIDRWAAMTQAYATQRDLHDTVLAMFVAAYDTVDRDYWPAHVAAARYLLDHGNKKQAGEELELANDANPNAPSVNILMGEMQRSARSEAGMAEAIRSLRAVDPRSMDADLLEVALKLQQRAFSDALAIATRSVERQPQNLDALAHLAAAHAARGEEAPLTQTLARIDALDPDNAAARVLVADTLATVYYDSAGALRHLQTAVERAPWWTAPQHALGIANIQEGEEDQARVVLSKAYELDPYNILTVNYLRVLDELSKFKEFESERFIFRYAEQDDPIVPLYIAPQMDEMYVSLTEQFGYRPEKKPIIEVFPDAQSFSVRTAGMPGLETYGASLGRVMTTVAPRAGETLGPFNWTRVLRHEFTHTLNLMYTHGRVPRWLTEGLAVWQEKVPYRFANVPEQMYELATKKGMPTPRDMAQVKGEMHYMTGFWIVRYVDETFGWPSVLKLLDAYRAGKEENEAFRDATGMDVVAFHRKFSEWSKEQVKGWGYDEETAKKVEAIEKEAETLTQGQQYDKAAAKWQEIATLQPMNPLPNRRLAGIYLRQSNPSAALPYLKATLPLELQDNRYAKRLARIYDEAKDPTSAMEMAKTAIGIDPYDPDAHDLLAALHERAGDAPRVAQEKQMAQLLRERKERAGKAE